MSAHAFDTNGKSTPSFVQGLLEGMPVVRVRTRTDTLPGGWSLAMFPAMVDWSASRLENKPGDYYVVRFVNVGGNPVTGDTVLQTVRVPCAGVRGVEFVLAPIRILGVGRLGAHAQLRILFHKDARPVIIGQEGAPPTPDALLPDLVFSWEAWRSPDERFSTQRGLDPKSYALTLRGFSGPQRFLEDTLKRRRWICYPLKLESVEGAGNEILSTSLLLGDSMARHFLATLLGRESMTSARSRFAASEELENWSQLRVLLEEETPEQPLAPFLGGEFSYQLLQRSCITMALTAIDMAMASVYARNGLGAWHHLRVGPKDIPDWIKDFAHGSAKTVFDRLPAAIWWLVKNHEVIPRLSYEILDNAGLLVHQDGEIRRLEYSIRGRTPYGALQRNLIF